MADDSESNNVVRLVKTFDGSLSTPESVISKDRKLSLGIMQLIMKRHRFPADQVEAVLDSITDDDLDLFMTGIVEQFGNFIDAIAFRERGIMTA